MSPIDGRSIVSGGSDAEGAGLFVFPADGGPPSCLVREAAFNPDWSPRRDVIVFDRSQLNSDIVLIER